MAATLALLNSKHKHPINDLLELLGRRWALRVLWELRDAPLPYAELRRRCDEVSTSVLAQRLKDLAEGGIVEQRAGAYGLTEDGRELAPILLDLDAWSRR
ncbi:helix-turn-helix domain-containing protein [Conexibacter sp. SYSU D00693]|uniref:winged helix-turn-helix transcriptional regulator n=1 Tax=Conexibacter sp. SYSU D00693 TaxID=2812560 RepID=UPI00196BA1DB|nr:helix-turn-helix domain-containing protein [Conexibacter sp. SYSU D00693]